MPDAFTIGIDLGGTDLKSALVRADGGAERFGKRPSRTELGVAGPFEAMEEAARILLDRAPGPITAVGVGCPGVVHPEEGRLVDRTAHLPCWRDQPIVEELERRLKLPVTVDNDANLAALAEHRFGAARGARVSLLFTLGTGIGCGIVLDGKVYRGAWGGAGEAGHVPLGREGTSCPCEVSGCVEPEASGSGLAAQAQRLGLEPATAASVFDHARAGAPWAQELVERFADRLGAVIGTAVNLFNPEIVVVGGGVAGAGDLLIAPLRAAVARYALASHRHGLRLEPAALGERAGTIGAGLLARERLGGAAGRG